ncbi:amidohydrolase [Halieaceae bacterium IMCC14734]|uniref:Amidohydrolase n=1 Tax=Candidatus Litorirhabdus singularis TaxID=2518993 RepID=A0ABT3TEI3_9GAMM|nr:amidohydrolase [Candidatus Litorirhabdus singularis]MCX2980725.1 amidohydrolase [Candidatus Litorirhabdus singularis]
MNLYTLVALAAFTLFGSISGCTGSGDDTVTIFTARSIITMDPELPTAEALAVRGDHIVSLGNLADLQKQFLDQDTRVDNRFADKVIMPGFIDPHVHPSIAATILPMEIVAAMAWPTAEGLSEPVRSAEAFLARLKQLDQQIPTDEWLMAWGYHEPYHGPMNRALLDQVSTERPIMLWQRSVHEMFFNSKALALLGLSKEAFAAEPHSNWQDGHIWEAALFSLGQPMIKKLAAPSSYLQGMSLMSDLIHRGGVTTVGEQGFPQVSTFLEYWTLRWESYNKPYRFVLVPNAMFLSNRLDSVNEVLAAADKLLRKSGDKIRVVKHVKYYADGAIYSQLMQMTEPYLDGHHGEWMIPPPDQRKLLQTFWRAGWDIHIHVNGDAGLDKVLDDIELLRGTEPQQHPRIVLEHYGYARGDQHARVKALDIAVSNNPYYLYELAPIYAEHGLGPSRAEDISPLGGLLEAGVGISFHSDFTMAPLQPLTLAWVAANRIASDGNQWGEHQVIPLQTALEAITIEAARSLGLESEIGSIEPGKKADFTVLEEDPYETPLHRLKDIEIWGTVYEGVAYPLTTQ